MKQKQIPNRVYRGFHINWNPRTSLYSVKDLDIGSFNTIGAVKRAIDGYIAREEDHGT